MIDIILNSIPIFLAISIGYLMNKKKLVPDNASETLSWILFNIVGPMLVFEIIYGLTIDTGKLKLLLITILTIPLLIGFASLISKVLNLNKLQKGALVLAMTLFGSGIVYPFVETNFSENVFGSFVVIDLFQFMLFLLCAPLLGYFLQKTNGDSKKFDLSKILKKIYKDPFLIAMFVALALTFGGIQVPEFLMNTMRFFGDSFFMLILILAGLTLKMPSRESLLKVAAIFTAKLLFLYGFAFLLFTIFGFNIEEISALVMLYSAPFASIVIVYAKEYKLDSGFVSQLVVFSILAQLIVYPVVIAIIKVLA